MSFGISTVTGGLAFKILREIYKTSWPGPSGVNITITGLSIKKDKLYILRVTQRNDPNNVWTMIGRVFINGDTNTAKYYIQYLVLDGTTINANRVNDTWVINEGLPGTFPAPTIAGAAVIYIFIDPGGYARIISIANMREGSSMKVVIAAIFYTVAVTDITSISYIASGSSGELVLYGGMP